MTEILLYTQTEVADRLKISTSTLEAMRQKGNGPEYCKIGRRVLYSHSDLLKYLSSNSYKSTSEY